MSADDFEFIDRLWADWSPGYDGAWDAARVKEAIGHPDNLAAAIGYYRAMFDPTLHRPEYADAQSAAHGRRPRSPRCTCTAPTTGRSGSRPSATCGTVLSAGSKYVVIESAGHFLHLQQPDAVRDHVLSFLAG